MDYHLKTFIERTPGQQDLAATPQAQETNICAESNNLPLETSTRVFLSEADYVAHMDLDIHSTAIISEAQIGFISTNRKLRMQTIWTVLSFYMLSKADVIQKLGKYVMMCQISVSLSGSLNCDYQEARVARSLCSIMNPKRYLIRI